jgi:hypothetical protein
LRDGRQPGHKAIRAVDIKKECNQNYSTEPQMTDMADTKQDIRQQACRHAGMGRCIMHALQQQAETVTTV